MRSGRASLWSELKPGQSFDRMRTAIMAAAALLLIGGCKTTNQNPEEGVIESTGTVEYIDLEGGFYGIVSEDGRRFDPTDLAEEFRQDGLRIRFRVRPREGLVGTHMWGTLVEVLEIKRL